MQFKVPQFLEIEDKIFGPFTFRQFVYLTGGAGMCFLLYRLLGLWVSAIPIVAIAGFALALAFYKPNNKPFIFMVQAVFKYFLQGRMYIWKNPKNGILIKNQVQAGLGIGNQNISCLWLWVVMFLVPRFLPVWKRCLTYWWLVRRVQVNP